MRFLLLVGTVFLIFGVVCLAAVRYFPFSSRIPKYLSILLPDEDCPECWQGIHPSDSLSQKKQVIFATFPEAISHNSTGHFQFTLDKTHTYQVSSLGPDLYVYPKTITLREIIFLLGIPHRQLRLSSERCMGSMLLIYPQRNMVVFMDVGSETHIKPELPVSSIRYGDVRSCMLGGGDWQGYDAAMDSIPYVSDYN